MVFSGESEHTNDAKHRLAIPAELRARLNAEVHGEGFYLVPGPNGALWVWPQLTFERMAGALEQTLLPGEEMMDFEELMFSQATRVDLDATGRIRVPERVCRRHDLGTEVTILGVKDHLEIRDTGQWQKLRDQKLARQGEIMLRARKALESQTRGGLQDRP